eukprot:CAMPEP_0195158130 /NCGR_PEP_ID=MMETSP0448-20130528/185509_1 /TAXON_ID=66468 /ORGANISM="Heterocapsa triquestra, Strain CCMP 448" /LENGTH=433 /DNA_ID=CAMNT_0040196925 /DNA_START=1 /DNA_END=1300 /DNA_ORIENTATION=-
MLDACAKCCAMDRAAGLLEDMRESCVEPDIITYSTIIKGYCLEGDVDRAFHVLEDMKNDGKFMPDEIMYNSILDGCAKQHRTDEALRILDEMRAAGVGPSNYTLSILVKLLGHARRLSQAFRMVEELSTQNGFKPNVQVYTCMVQACVLNRKLDKALALHDTMLADASCRTDEKFYAVLVRGCMQLHQPWKALEVVRAAYQLPGHSLASPARKDAPVVGVEARTLDEVMGRLQAGGQEERQAVTELTSELWDGAAFASAAAAAAQVQVPVRVTSATAAQAAAAAADGIEVAAPPRRLGQAFRMVEELSTQNGFKPNVQVYTCLVQACILNRKLDKALALHDTMLADAGCHTDEKFYAVLARGCIQLHQPMKALEVVRAAYQLSGHSLASPARKDARVVGVEGRTLDEVAAKLQAGSQDEQNALAQLTTELWER